MFRLQLWLRRPSLVRGVARMGQAAPERISYGLPRSYSGSPWWKGAIGRSYSRLLQQWHALRKAVGVSPHLRVRRPSPPTPLLLLGTVAFVWERERITTDEIVSCLKEYEVVVMSRLKRPLLQSPQSESDVNKLSATDASTSHRETQDGGDRHNQQAPSREPSGRSRREEERELRRQLFIQEARSVYEQHSRESLSKLPLVGLKQESRLYNKSCKIADACRGLKILAVEQTSRLSLVRYLSRSLTDAALRGAIFSEATSFASDFSAVGGTCDVTTEDIGRPVSPESTDVPLVGMKTRSDSSSSLNLLEKFFKAARKFCHTVSDSHSDLMIVVGTFDNILGADSLALQQATLSTTSRGSAVPSSRCETTKAGETPEKSQRSRDTSTVDSRSELRADSSHILEDAGTDCKRNLRSTCTDLATQPQSEAHQLPVESAEKLTVAADPSAVTPETRVLGGCGEGAGPTSREVDCRSLPEDDVSCEHEEKDGSLAGWELMTKQGTCTAYRKPYKDTGLFQYKVIGTFDDITAKDYLDVQVEYEARKSWDSYTVKMEKVDSDPCSGSEVIHWIFKYPFPMSSREYVFVRRSWVNANEDSIVLINRSVEHPKVQAGRRLVRVRDYYSTMVIRSHSFIDELGLDYELTYFDDPQISLPHSCVNWITTTAMPDFMAKIHTAARHRASCNRRKQMEGL